MVTLRLRLTPRTLRNRRPIRLLIAMLLVGVLTPMSVAPLTVVRPPQAAAAPCPPDCGGSGGDYGSPGGGGQQFQPPSMGGQPPGYSGGINSGYPGLDPANGISINNPAGQVAVGQEGTSPQYPQQPQPRRPVHGQMSPNYDAPPQPAPSAAQSAPEPSAHLPAPQQPEAQQQPTQPTPEPTVEPTPQPTTRPTAPPTQKPAEPPPPDHPKTDTTRPAQIVQRPCP
jgi:hypothetical protein